MYSVRFIFILEAVEGNLEVQFHSTPPARVALDPDYELPKNPKPLKNSKERRPNKLGSGHFSSPIRSKCVLHLNSKLPKVKELQLISKDQANCISELRNDLKLLINSYPGFCSLFDKDIYRVLCNLPTVRDNWTKQKVCGSRNGCLRKILKQKPKIKQKLQNAIQFSVETDDESSGESDIDTVTKSNSSSDQDTDASEHSDGSSGLAPKVKRFKQAEKMFKPLQKK